MMVTQKLKTGAQVIEPYNNIVDMEGKPCTNGCGGVYRVTAVLDHLGGKLQCITCHERIDRYVLIDYGKSPRST
jgi:hypothetical protein